MDLEEIGINAGNWIDSAQDSNYWRALVNAIHFLYNMHTSVINKEIVSCPDYASLIIFSRSLHFKKYFS